jgi:hypothetical protein
MKRFFTKLILTAALAAVTALTQSAQAQVTPLTITSGLSNTWVITNAFFLLSTNQKIATVWQGRGLAISGIWGGTADFTTGKVCLRFTVSADGTNYCSDTNMLINVWLQPEGVKPVVFYTNLPASLLDNATYIKLYDLTNANSGSATCVVGRLTNLMYLKKN